MQCRGRYHALAKDERCFCAAKVGSRPGLLWVKSSRVGHVRSMSVLPKSGHDWAIHERTELDAARRSRALSPAICRCTACTPVFARLATTPRSPRACCARGSMCALVGIQLPLVQRRPEFSRGSRNLSFWQRLRLGCTVPRRVRLPAATASATLVATGADPTCATAAVARPSVACRQGDNRSRILEHSGSAELILRIGLQGHGAEHERRCS
jgi:hypothetical protein